MEDLFNNFHNDTFLLFTERKNKVKFKNHYIKHDFIKMCKDENLDFIQMAKNKKIESIEEEKILFPNFQSLLNYYYNNAFYKKDDLEKIEKIINDDIKVRSPKRQKILYDTLRKIKTNSINKKEYESLKEEFLNTYDWNLTNKISSIDKIKKEIGNNYSLRQFFFNEILKPENHDIKTIFVNERFNPSQIRAIDNSLNNYLTILQGPPGTGKSTTIINIIISAVLAGKTVLVCANNNLPVDGIMESLKEFGFNQF